MTASGHAAFGGALKRHGLVSPDDNRILGEAFIYGISGVASTKGMGQAASPMTPALALLQNVAGVHATLRPPNLSKTIELMLVLGSSTTPQETAAEAWARAASIRTNTDPLLRVIDAAVAEVMLPGLPQPRNQAPLHEELVWTGLFPKSPFSWFAAMWQTINREDWVRALPARVWTDWATTVLRLAFGAAYLWEASWYETIARTVLSRSTTTWNQLVEDMAPPLQWHPRANALSVRDLAPVLMWRVHRSSHIAKELTLWLEGKAALSADEALAAMHDDDELKEKLVRHLGSKRKSSSGNNTWEAIRYALRVRDSQGEHADHYGLLTQHNRFLTVEPKTEWVAVIASLSCAGPGGEIEVASVLANLSELGIRPELVDLINLLERAGMARGSADADQGVRVKSAF